MKPHSQKTHITTIRVVSGNEAYTSALIKEPPVYFSKSAIILSCACLIGFFCSTCNGFDGSLFNSLLEIDEFKAFFNVPDNGIWAGIVTSMYQIGSVVAIPFIGPSIDTWGRKVGMAIGATFIILGTIIQGATTANASVGQFMGGRFLLGFGVGIISSAGPMYVVEVSHPALRSVMTAMYNCFW
jgi:MFS family permease